MSLFPQICTKVLERNANPQWNQNLSLPIRVRATLLPTSMRFPGWARAKAKVLCFVFL